MSRIRTFFRVIDYYFLTPILGAIIYIIAPVVLILAFLKGGKKEFFYFFDLYVVGFKESILSLLRLFK